MKEKPIPVIAEKELEQKEDALGDDNSLVFTPSAQSPTAPTLPISPELNPNYHKLATDGGGGGIPGSAEGCANSSGKCN